MHSLLFSNWWSTLKIEQQIFWSIAIVFSLFSIILFVLDLLEEENDGEVALVKKNRLLDTHTILTFFTAFGWTAIISSIFTNSIFQVLIFAAIAALLICYIQGLLFGFPWTRDLSIKKLMASTGEVLQPIPPHRNGTGKVQLAIRKSSFELEALTSGQELPAGASIRVVDIIEERILVVEPIDTDKPPNI